MAILKIKDETGKFVDIPAIQGAPGKDGAIQYEAGENIKIDGNVINTDGDVIKKIDMTNGLTKEDITALPTGLYKLVGSGTIEYFGRTYGTEFMFVTANHANQKNCIILRSDGTAYVFLVSSASTWKIYDYSNALFKNNTTQYDVTGNYNPAHKKYVDDSIKAAITTTLEGGY